MATTVARLQVVLGVNDSQMREGFAAARREIKSFVDDVQRNAVIKLTADKAGIDAAMQDVRKNYQGTQQAIAKNPIKIIPQVNINPALQRMNSLRQRLVTTGFDLQRTGQALTAGVTIPIIAMGAAALKGAEEFSNAQRIIRLGTGATGKQLQSLMKSFENVAAEAPATFREVAQVVGELSDRTGLFGPQLEHLAEQVLAFARATGEEALPSVATTTRLFSDWGIKTNQLSDAMNFLFRIQQETGVSTAKLAKEVTFFGVPLRQLGFNFEQAVATIAKFEREGVNTQTVLSGMRLALGKFAKEGIKDPQLALKLLAERFKAVGSAGEANSLSVAVFGRRAGADMASAVREGRFAIDDLLKSVHQSGEDMIKASKANESLDQSFQKLRNQVVLAIKPIAVDLLQAFKTLLPDLQRVIHFIAIGAEVFSKLPTPVKLVAVGFLAAAAATGPFLIGLGSVVMAIPGLIKLVGFIIFLFGGPWTIALALAGAAIIALVTLWVTNLGNFRNKTIAFFDWLKAGFKQAFQVVLDVVITFGNLIAEATDLVVITLQQIWLGFTTFFLGQIEDAGARATDLWQKHSDSVVSIFQGLIPRLAQKIASLKEMLILMLGGGTEEQRSAFAESMMNQIKDAFIGGPVEQTAGQVGLKIGKLIGHNIGAGIKGNVGETNRQLDAIAAAAKKKIKLTDAQRQDLAITKAISGARAAYNELLNGEGTIAAQVARKYFLLSDARRAELVNILQRTKLAKQEIDDNRAVRDAIEKVRAERELLLTKDPTAKVRAQYQHASKTLVTTLATEQMALARVKEEQDRINSSRRKFAESISEVNEKLRLRHIGQLALEMADIRHQMPAITEDQARFLAQQVRRNEAEQKNFETQRDLAMQILTVNGAVEKNNIRWQAFGDQILDNTELIQKFVFGLKDADGNIQHFGGPELDANSKKVADNILLLTRKLQEMQGIQKIRDLRANMKVLAADTDEARAAMELFPREFTFFAHSAKDATAAIARMPVEFQDVIAEMAATMQQSRVLEGTRTVIDSMQGVFENFFGSVKDGFGAMIGSIVTGFEDMLVQIAAKFLAARLTEVIAGAIPGATQFLGGVVGNSDAKVQIAAATQSAAIMSTAITTSGATAATALATGVSTGGVTVATGVGGALTAGAAGLITALGTGAIGIAQSMATGGFTAAGVIANAMIEAATIAAQIIAASTASAGNADSIGSLFPARAMGGSVAAGQGYLVGEHGPELFRPRSSGNIVPNNRMSSETGANYHLSININNPVNVREFQASQSQVMAEAHRQFDVMRRRNG